MNVAASQSASHNSFSSQHSAVSPSTSCFSISVFHLSLFPLLLPLFSFFHLHTSLSLSPPLPISLCRFAFSIIFMKSSSLISFQLQAVSLERISKSFESRVGGDATGGEKKGIKTRKLRSEERWDVSWTEKFLRFPEARPDRPREGGRDRGRKRLYITLVYQVQVIYSRII